MFTFPKAEHICLQTEIEALFSAGSSSMTVYPIRATFRTTEFPGHGPRAKVLLSVSKRKLRHAVDRNRAKRQLREAYRLQKALCIDQLPEGVGVNIAFIWLADHPVKSETVSKCVQTILQRIPEKLNME